MGKSEDLAVKMGTAGQSRGDHMECVIFTYALPAEYEVKARHLTSCDSIGRDGNIKAVLERHHLYF